MMRASVERRRDGDDSWSVAADLLFGAVLPVCCLVFDPIVFRGFDDLDPLLPEHRWAGWIGLGFLIVLLAWWRLRRPYRGYAPGLVSGAFFVGGLVALAFGVWLAPFVLYGAVFPLWGVLALVPFPTAVVYLVNARRAYAVAHDRVGTGARLLAGIGAVATVACGSALVLLAA